MYEELKKLAEAFPADLDWDSNTEPFFNGASGESLGGGATGFYSVYGKPFRLEGEDYDYDGPTYVEACNADFAKFMVAARDGVLALIAENEANKERADAEQESYDSQRRVLDAVKAERDLLKAEVDSLTREADRQYTTIEAYRKDAERFRWLLKNASVILDKKTAYPAETGFIKFDTMPGRTETESAIDAAMSQGVVQ